MTGAHDEASTSDTSIDDVSAVAAVPTSGPCEGDDPTVCVSSTSSDSWVDAKSDAQPSASSSSSLSTRSDPTISQSAVSSVSGGDKADTLSGRSADKDSTSSESHAEVIGAPSTESHQCVEGGVLTLSSSSSSSSSFDDGRDREGDRSGYHVESLAHGDDTTDESAVLEEDDDGRSFVSEEEGDQDKHGIGAPVGVDGDDDLGAFLPVASKSIDREDDLDDDLSSLTSYSDDADFMSTRRKPVVTSGVLNAPPSPAATEEEASRVWKETLVGLEIVAEPSWEGHDRFHLEDEEHDSKEEKDSGRSPAESLTDNNTSGGSDSDSDWSRGANSGGAALRGNLGNWDEHQIDGEFMGLPHLYGPGSSAINKVNDDDDDDDDNAHDHAHAHDPQLNVHDGHGDQVHGTHDDDGPSDRRGGIAHHGDITESGEDSFLEQAETSVQWSVSAVAGILSEVMGGTPMFGRGWTEKPSPRRTGAESQQFNTDPSSESDSDTKTGPLASKHSAYTNRTDMMNAADTMALDIAASLRPTMNLSDADLVRHNETVAMGAAGGTCGAASAAESFEEWVEHLPERLTPCGADVGVYLMNVGEYSSAIGSDVSVPEYVSSTCCDEDDVLARFSYQVRLQNHGGSMGRRTMALNVDDGHWVSVSGVGSKSILEEQSRLRALQKEARLSGHGSCDDCHDDGHHDEGSMMMGRQGSALGKKKRKDAPGSTGPVNRVPVVRYIDVRDRDENLKLLPLDAAPWLIDLVQGVVQETMREFATRCVIAWRSKAVAPWERAVYGAMKDGAVPVTHVCVTADRVSHALDVAMRESEDSQAGTASLDAIAPYGDTKGRGGRVVEVQHAGKTGGRFGRGSAKHSTTAALDIVAFSGVDRPCAWLYGESVLTSGGDANGHAPPAAAAAAAAATATPPSSSSSSSSSLSSSSLSSQSGKGHDWGDVAADYAPLVPLPPAAERLATPVQKRGLTGATRCAMQRFDTAVGDIVSVPLADQQEVMLIDVVHAMWTDLGFDPLAPRRPAADLHDDAYLMGDESGHDDGSGGVARERAMLRKRISKKYRFVCIQVWAHVWHNALFAITGYQALTSRVVPVGFVTPMGFACCRRPTEPSLRGAYADATGMARMREGMTLKPGEGLPRRVCPGVYSADYVDARVAIPLYAWSTLPMEPLCLLSFPQTGTYMDGEDHSYDSFEKAKVLRTSMLHVEHVKRIQSRFEAVPQIATGLLYEIAEELFEELLLDAVGGALDMEEEWARANGTYEAETWRSVDRIVDDADAKMRHRWQERREALFGGSVEGTGGGSSGDDGSGEPDENASDLRSDDHDTSGSFVHGGGRATYGEDSYGRAGGHGEEGDGDGDGDGHGFMDDLDLDHGAMHQSQDNRHSI